MPFSVLSVKEKRPCGASSWCGSVWDVTHKRAISPTQRRTLLYAGGGAVAVGGIWLLARKRSKIPVPQASPILKKYGLVGGANYAIAGVRRWVLPKVNIDDAREAWTRTLAYSRAARELLGAVAKELEEAIGGPLWALAAGPATAVIQETVVRDFRETAVDLEVREGELSAYLVASGVERHVDAILLVLGKVKNIFLAIETYQKSLFVRLLRLVNAVGTALEALLLATVKVVESTAKLVTVAATTITWFPWFIVAGGTLALGIWAFKGRGGGGWRADRALPGGG